MIAAEAAMLYWYWNKEVKKSNETAKADGSKQWIGKSLSMLWAAEEKLKARPEKEGKSLD